LSYPQSVGDRLEDISPASGQKTGKPAINFLLEEILTASAGNGGLWARTV
jgi:hypothetical protein